MSSDILVSKSNIGRNATAGTSRYNACFTYTLYAKIFLAVYSNSVFSSVISNMSDNSSDVIPVLTIMARVHPVQIINVQFEKALSKFIEIINVNKTA